MSIDSSTALAPETHLAVHRDALARAHQHHVAVAHLLHRQLHARRRSRATRAVLGCRSASARSAAEVCRLARASSVLPTRTSPMMKITAS